MTTTEKRELVLLLEKRMLELNDQKLINPLWYECNRIMDEVRKEEQQEKAHKFFQNQVEMRGENEEKRN